VQQGANATGANVVWGNAPSARPAVVPVSLVHKKGPSTFTGAKLSDTALASLNGIKAGEYGTTTVQLPQADGTTKSFTVRDLQYEVGGGKMGAHFVTVQDGAPAGSKAIDTLIRKESGLKADEPIFALIAYVHPEEHHATLKQAATQMLKTEMGSTHLGAYTGEGKTTNSPETYHNKSWGVNDGTKPYPANVQVISLEGVKQGTLNKNMRHADSVLNFGVKFPPDYKNDRMNTADLNSTLMFYRDWLKNEPYLKTDPLWATYCAEHKTIVANIGLNVPHNEASFKEIFGTEGAALWKTYKVRFKEATGRDFKASDETSFEPLWKKEGLTAVDIKAPTLAEYDKYQKARFSGDIASGTYRSYKPITSGKGMAWKPETTADLMKNFMETYAPFREVGGYASAATLMGFQETVVTRMGLPPAKFMESVMPVMSEVMIAEGMARAPADPAHFGAWAEQATGGLYLAFGGNAADLAQGGTVNAQLMGLAKGIMGGVAQAAPQIAQAAKGAPAKRNDVASAWLKKAIQDNLEKARELMVASPDKTEIYSPPAVTNRVIQGMVDKSKFVNIRTIATAIDAAHTAP
jgi:hypothetical protein